MSEALAVAWQPSPGPQTEFLESSAYEVLYGGAAGGGKTDSIVVAPLRWVHLSGFNGIIFRRTFPELEGQVIPRSRALYPSCGGIYNSVQHCWLFPSGARIHFGHIQHEYDVLRYQGWEFQYIGFDELTQFLESQYVYMLSRARSTRGIPIRIRSSSNPGGPGHDWVLKRWAPWLDRRPEYKWRRAAPSEVLAYRNTDDGEQWLDPARDVLERHGHHLSRVFIPAKATDNPHLMKSDPQYLERLGGLDAVTRAWLRDGDWMAMPGAGMYFKRDWFRFIDRPLPAKWKVRRWDLASVEGGGDWTVGVLMARTEEGFVIEDVIRGQWRPDGVQRTVLSTAAMDGRGVQIVIPQDPGQAGKAQCDAYAALLTGYNVRFERETGDKVTRAQPFSAQCEARKASIVRAPWNQAFMQCLEAFPDENAHDDDVDAAAGAFNALASNPATFGGVEWSGPRYTFAEDETGDDDWTGDNMGPSGAL